MSGGLLVHVCRLAILFASGGMILAKDVVVSQPPAATKPFSPGTGLRGYLYLGHDVSSLSEADQVIRTNSPDGEFRAYRIDFSNESPGGQDMASFLGTNLSVPHAANLQSTLRQRDVMPSVIRLSGLIRITKLSARFALSSDDGSRLIIGGVTVIDNDGAHSASFGPGIVRVRFLAPGLYPIEIVYFETQGAGASLALFSDAGGISVPCEGCIASAPDTTLPIAPTSILYPDRSLLSRLFRPGSAGASRLSLSADRDSATVGETISYNVSLQNGVGEPVPAEADLNVDLASDGGEFQPSTRIVIPKGSKSAAVSLLVRKVGGFLVRALAEGKPTIDPTQLAGVGCSASSTKIASMLLNPTMSTSGYTDTGLSFKILFVDENNEPTPVQDDTTFELVPKGVGQLVGYDVDAKKLDQRLIDTVKKGECAAIELASSGDPGVLTVQARYEPVQITKALDLTFMLRLTLALLLLVVVGSVPGTFVRVRRHRQRGKPNLWGTYAVGGIAGIAAYLFYYFFISLKGVRMSDGYGIAFLIGLLGGYLGSGAMERVSGWLIPSPRSTEPRGKDAG